MARIRRWVAAFVAAGAIGVVGIGAVSAATAQAAGVVVEHRAYGAPAPAVPPREDETS